ncbi:hypothetical protein FKM82_027727, partial [Ascaphus truei]
LPEPVPKQHQPVTQFPLPEPVPKQHQPVTQSYLPELLEPVALPTPQILRRPMPIPCPSHSYLWQSAWVPSYILSEASR